MFKKYGTQAHLVLAGALAPLAGLAVGLAAAAAALAAHHLILASRSHIVAAILAGILARIATVTTSVGHFIFRHAIFFTQVGRGQLCSKLEAKPNLQPCVPCPPHHSRNAPRFPQRQESCLGLSVGHALSKSI